MTDQPPSWLSCPSPRTVGWTAFLVLLAVYAATLAPSVTWWDSGELIAAVHSLGIPHPPGTAVYVLVGRVWGFVTWPLEYALRINMLSAGATAAGVALLGSMLARWTRDPIAAFAAAVCAGATSSVWRNANEAEVYALALLGSVVIVWAADRAGSENSGAAWKWALLTAYVAGLGYSLHLAALVTVPAALLLLAPTRIRLNPARVVGILGVVALGASAVLYLIVRAQHDPWVNQGNPATWSAFLDVLRREQYPSPGLWPRQAPLYLQIGNWFEYADWQFALGLHPEPPPSFARTLVTALFVALGVFGSIAHRAIDRRSWRALAVLFATASLGVIVYLNLKAGPSFGAGVLPEGAPREARERDYFFATSFMVWGLWAGFGAVRIARRLARPAGHRDRRLLLATAAIVAAAPIALNWRAVDRRAGDAATEPIARARGLLEAVPRGGVLLSAADNDTYPLWYAQRVEGIREDVTGVTLPLLATRWYRAELRRRHDLLDETTVETWRGVSETVAVVCQRARAAGRELALTPYASRHRLPPSCDRDMQ